MSFVLCVCVRTRRPESGPPISPLEDPSNSRRNLLPMPRQGMQSFSPRRLAPRPRWKDSVRKLALRPRAQGVGRLSHEGTWKELAQQGVEKPRPQKVCRRAMSTMSAHWPYTSVVLTSLHQRLLRLLVATRFSMPLLSP